MLLPLHLLFMGIAAGLVGTVGRRVVAAQGWIPDFETGLLATAGIACAYLALSGILLVFVQVIIPAKSRGLLIADLLSHAAAPILLLYLLPITLPWPHPALERMEGLILFGLFAGIHAFLKLLALYAALESNQKKRPILAPWLLLIILSSSGAMLCLRSAREPEAQERYRSWVRGHITQYADTAIAQGQQLHEQL